jgi:AsmA-like C-terminal region
VFVETNDAGAFFSFTDIYPKIVGGEMWVALDPQSADKAPQEGTLAIRDFAVRGEQTLDRVAAMPQHAGAPSPGVEFSRLRVDFTRSLGRFTVRDGLVKGPAIGATVDGYIDYMRSEVRMRGTFVPLYGLNNMFGQIPIVGLFLGGSNEGLIGLTYEVVGPPTAPVLRVNPISAVAPGLLRKFFEFPGGNGIMQQTPQTYAEPR